MRSNAERLRDILEAIANIEKYAVLGQSAFLEQELIQTWMVYNLQIIGEAGRAISEPLKAQYPNVPWVQIVALRNVAVHEYFRLDLDIIWRIVENDVPDLKSQIKAILQDVEAG